MFKINKQTLQTQSCIKSVPRHTVMSHNLIFSASSVMQIKVKFTLEPAMKAQRGSGGIALLFLQPLC